MEHEEAPAALAAVGASSCLDLFAFDSGVKVVSRVMRKFALVSGRNLLQGAA